MKPLRCRDSALRFMASVQCESTQSLGIGFSRFKKANNRPKATWNRSQCDTATYFALSAALVFIHCLIIFCICPVTRKCPSFAWLCSVSLIHVHLISTCAVVSLAHALTVGPGITPRVFTLVFFIFQALHAT